MNVNFVWHVWSNSQICDNMPWSHGMIKSNTTYYSGYLSSKFIYVSSYKKSRYRLVQRVYKPVFYAHLRRNSRHMKYVDRAISDTATDKLQTCTHTFLAYVWHATFSILQPSYVASVWQWVFSSSKANQVIHIVYWYPTFDRTTSDRHTHWFAN